MTGPANLIVFQSDNHARSVLGCHGSYPFLGPDQDRPDQSARCGLYGSAERGLVARMNDHGRQRPGFGGAGNQAFILCAAGLRA